MTDYAARLAALRAELARYPYDGFLVPMADEYQSEYPPPSSQRIAFLSGFTGSAGLIIVLPDRAAFFTDGRYTLQASQQVSTALFTLHDSTVKPPQEWLGEHVKPGMKIAFDPWLHTADGVKRLEKVLAKAGAELAPIERNPVDAVWKDRPPAPMEPVYPHDIGYAGKTSGEKRQVLANDLRQQSLDAAVITDPASVAWLLNVRGGDVPSTPLPLSFAVLYADATAEWFIDKRKLTKDIPQHLGSQVKALARDDFAGALDRLGKQNKAVRIDPKEAPFWIVERLRLAGAKLDLGDDPCTLPKACKNTVELDGMRAAHRRDGAALVKFFAWLEKNFAAGLDEIAAAEKLAEFRAANDLYRGPSFQTISGAGPNGAIVHYQATELTNRKLEEGHFYLLDSGGQYLDGTTDVTRTIALGIITPEMRDRFTRVLKGHIALATIRFPEGTTGAELDALARQYLWAAGIDYNHGTGHGVGSYLGVHEGPQAISRRSNVPLKFGMVLSNEPGYYRAGHYGIRIENLQTVTEATEVAGGEHKMLGFETLTLVPIDRNAIEASMLSDAERLWLNSYHARVREVLRPMLDPDSVKWLEKATGEA